MGSAIRKTQRPREVGRRRSHLAKRIRNEHDSGDGYGEQHDVTMMKVTLSKFTEILSVGYICSIWTFQFDWSQLMPRMCENDWGRNNMGRQSDQSVQELENNLFHCFWTWGLLSYPFHHDFWSRWKFFFYFLIDV